MTEKRLYNVWEPAGLGEKIRAYIQGSEDIGFVCIGSDRATGDSYGPLVGTFLERAGVQTVYGTLVDTLNATNIEEGRCNWEHHEKVVAIDASLTSKPVRIRKIVVEDGGLKPGLGLGKDIAPIGSVSIKGMVNISTDKDLSLRVLQSTELSKVIEMAEVTSKAIAYALRREGKACDETACSLL